MRIRKVSQTPIPSDTAEIVDGYSTSTTNGYSCNYVNSVMDNTSKVLKYKTSTAMNVFTISGLNITEDNLVRINVIAPYTSSTVEILYFQVNDLTNYEFRQARLQANGTSSQQEAISTSADYLKQTATYLSIGQLFAFSVIQADLFIRNGKLAMTTHEARVVDGNQRELHSSMNVNKEVSTITSLTFRTSSNQIPANTRIFIEII